MYRPVLLFAALMLVACSPGSVTFAWGASPTFTPTSTPTTTPTSTPTQTPDATATAQAQVATQTAQTRVATDATGTAQAQAVTATAVARASATAAAVTAQANATATASAAAAGTKTAILAFVDALVAKAGRPEREREGEISANKWFRVSGTWKNFVLDVQFSNPSDPALHTWDYGFWFRYPTKDKYFSFMLRSNGSWILYYPEKSQADHIDLRRIGEGKIERMDVSATGSNKLRYVAYENSGFLYVNGEFVSMMDLSVNPSSGDLYLGTGLLINDNFPGLIVRFKDLSVAGLP